MKKSKILLLLALVAVVVLGLVTYKGYGQGRLTPAPRSSTMFVLFAEDFYTIGYQLQISEDGVSSNLALGVDYCTINKLGEKKCSFKFTDRSREDQSFGLIEDIGSFTLYGASSQYGVKLVDAQINDEGSDRAVIQLSRIR